MARLIGRPVAWTPRKGRQSHLSKLSKASSSRNLAARRTRLGSIRRDRVDPAEREPPVKHTTALAALVIAATSLASLPVAAQDLAPAADRGDREIHRNIVRDGGPGMGRGAGGILGLVCSEDGAERLE